MTERGAETVLVVEDNPDHAILVRIAARRAHPGLDVRVVENGDQAIAYLAGTGQFGDRVSHPFPRLVILDLVMPQTDGFGVLEWVGSRPELSDLSVVALTSSVNPGDEVRALQLGAEAFYHKPADLDELGETVRTIVERCLD